ncbi:hypothetical protein [Rhizobium sp. WYJ-E13]|uniref:hypothetical protein n=1 Tax=unclassified Rhizobium TaxID=2613769 RepID=UPI001C1EACEF|nr:hypothetical protein [Rhizobium sp. WYJ-E13]QWW68495.1 hypothetical protein KQ933_01940 [Rhizobium sp. WYJ-E13]
MWRGLMVLGVLLGAAGVAHADVRYFCSADDKDVRFTLESAFEDGGGHKLIHFRGALMLKDASKSQSFNKRIFESKDLTNRWSRDGDLRLEVFDTERDDTGSETLDLAVLAGEHGKPSPNFGGTYALRIESGASFFVVEGKVSCGTK